MRGAGSMRAVSVFFAIFIILSAGALGSLDRSYISKGIMKPAWLSSGKYVEYKINARKVYYTSGLSVELVSGVLTARYRWECEGVSNRWAKISVEIDIKGRGTLTIRSLNGTEQRPEFRDKSSVTILVNFATSIATLPNGTVVGPWLGWVPPRLQAGHTLYIHLEHELHYRYNNAPACFRGGITGTVKPKELTDTSYGTQETFDVVWAIPCYYRLVGNETSEFKEYISVTYDFDTGLALDPYGLFFVLLFMGIEAAIGEYRFSSLRTNIDLGPAVAPSHEHLMYIFIAACAGLFIALLTITYRGLRRRRRRFPRARKR